MVKFLFLLVFISTSHTSSKDAIDQYNQETIDLFNDLDSCLLRVDYAIAQADEIDYEYGKAYALYLKGYIHRVQNDLGKAFLANLKGLNVLHDVDDERAPETLVRLYLNTGEILKKHFKYSDAIKYYNEGLEVAYKENLTNWIIDLTYNIGSAYWTKGELDNASNKILEAYELAQKEEDEHTILNALNLMGLIFRDNHIYDTAELFFTKMLTYSYQDLDADKYKGRAYHNLANTYAHAGDTAKAINAFSRALEYKLVGNKPKEIFITENDLAELYYSLGDYNKAHQIAVNCIEHYESVRLDPDHYKVFDLARKVNSELSEHQLADHYANRYFDENEKFLKQQEKLIEIRDQFKMEVLTASFFGELERNKRISNLNEAVLWILIFSGMIIGYLIIRQIWVKNLVERELDKLANG